MRQRLILLLILTLVLSVPTPVFSASDIKGHWAESTINAMVEKGHISGYPNGLFKPNASISRAEFAVVISSILGLDEEKDKTALTDVSTDHWATGAINAAVDAGIITGYEDGTFKPNADISRAEMATMAVRALMLEEGLENVPSAESHFSDEDRIPEWAKRYVSYASSEGLISGYSDGSFSPNSGATRAEAVVILNRTEKKLQDNAQHGGGVTTPPEEEDGDEDASTPPAGGGGTPGGQDPDRDTSLDEYGHLILRDTVKDDVYSEADFELAVVSNPEDVHLMVKPENEFSGIELKISNADDETVEKAVYEKQDDLDRNGWFVLTVDESISTTISVSATVYAEVEMNEININNETTTKTVTNHYNKKIDRIIDSYFFLDAFLDHYYVVDGEHHVPKTSIRYINTLYNGTEREETKEIEPQDIELTSSNPDVIETGVNSDDVAYFFAANEGTAELTIKYGEYTESYMIDVYEKDPYVYVVGEDIQPGLYFTTGEVHWQLIDEDGNTISSGYSASGEPAYVEINESDHIFKPYFFDDGEWEAFNPNNHEILTKFSSGQYKVGVDIEPGIYYESGEDEDYVTLFARLSSFGRESNNITSGYSQGQLYVEVKEDDEGLEVIGGDWVKYNEDTHPHVMNESFSDGMYLVGKDIEPGSYKVTVPKGKAIYWAALSGLDHTLEQINRNKSIQAQDEDIDITVDVKEEDMAFFVESYGDSLVWSKVDDHDS
ncbi:S-layer homology domain-containing protein [Caldalkalibacillus salinus]|uniref:S-layer homology domain-containing protein n=1 Tax=Caldalkalibacillus salinus TaxID=2803787 RepID=UPI001920836B|nr:S-layer homology domain-containing protein [Caldalkalibacillus salinus]